MNLLVTHEKGRFISLEGGEGTGKSTQMRRLCASLAASGKDYIATREPGGTPEAEKIRDLLVKGTINRWQPISEVLMHNVGRIEHIKSIIQPALESGKIVVCDRFMDSTLAYQGFGHKVDASTISNLQWLLYKDFKPDITFVLDLSIEEGLKRAKQRKGDENRYENMSKAFHQRVKQGFLEIAAAEPKRCVIINATGDENIVHKRIMLALRERLDLP